MEFIRDGYDPCPTCKRSANLAVADSVRFRMILHVRGRADTLRMSIDGRGTVGKIRDFLGRRRPEASACP